MNLPDGWHVYPLADVTIGLFVLLVAILVVQILILRVLKSFQPPKEPRQSDKQEIENISFRDMR